MGNIIINPFLHSTLCFPPCPDVALTILLLDDAEEGPGGGGEEAPLAPVCLPPLVSRLSLPSLSGLEQGG